ncbi:hypothetical protein GIB67_032821 [Kingdonia uniflora]|uniref:Peroxidase n=1 Tax=Kingdonia uniflora TaxID=39325 RepID=A0A7J7NBX0_9MAGN|nr:hypothetical protein GIB67_032821 [Kingdonia uniflora]
MAKLLYSFVLLGVLSLALATPISSRRLSSLQNEELEYDFYRNSCPKAESIVRTTMEELYRLDQTTAPRLLRLVFHDCFVEGCDGSVLLDENSGNMTEKSTLPNQTLKGFEHIDTIKSRLEETCPGTVSCADIVVLAAREAVLQAGGPFYPVYTGRADSTKSHDEHVSSLPSPFDTVGEILRKFDKKRFGERETVSLLGGHSIGKIDCQFVRERLYNFSGSGKPDGSISAEYLVEMRRICKPEEESHSSTSSPSPSPSPSSFESAQVGEPAIQSRQKFDTHYYQKLIDNKGSLVSDQTFMDGGKTEALVRAYASDSGSTFRRDFARSMIKMSSLPGNPDFRGPVRFNCSRLFSSATV